VDLKGRGFLPLEKKMGPYKASLKKKKAIQKRMTAGGGKRERVSRRKKKGEKRE